MSLVPLRKVWAILTVALRDTLPFCRISEFSRTSPRFAFVSRSIAVSLTSSPVAKFSGTSATFFPSTSPNDARMSNGRRVYPLTVVLSSLPRLISSAPSDSGLSSISPCGRMSSSALTTWLPSV